MNLRRPGRSRQLRRAVDTRRNDPECSRVRTPPLPLVLIGLLLLLAALPSSFILGIAPDALWRAMVALAVGSLGLAALAVMVAALTAGLPRSGALAGVLLAERDVLRWRYGDALDRQVERCAAFPCADWGIGRATPGRQGGSDYESGPQPATVAAAVRISLDVQCALSRAGKNLAESIASHAHLTDPNAPGSWLGPHHAAAYRRVGTYASHSVRDPGRLYAL